MRISMEALCESGFTCVCQPQTNFSHLRAPAQNASCVEIAAALLLASDDSSHRYGDELLVSGGVGHFFGFALRHLLFCSPRKKIAIRIPSDAAHCFSFPTHSSHRPHRVDTRPTRRSTLWPSGISTRCPAQHGSSAHRTGRMQAHRADEPASADMAIQVMTRIVTSFRRPF